MSSATAAARPVVTVFAAQEESKAAGSVPLPAVFTAPIRRDVIHSVASSVAKNARQAYAVSMGAGHQVAAESWGTGRAVSRIPRVPGGGTHRSGQGAFGNMCRGGHMYSPTRTWRKWHVKVSTAQRRYATASALAATAVPALVMARGHRIDEVDEVPLVLDGADAIEKTKSAVQILKNYGAYADVERAADSKKIRAGKGKMRNRRYVMRRGPLVVYSEGHGVERAFRNLPGVETCHVDRLNLLQLAPGGHVGRFVVWTKGAFEKLDSIFGTHDAASAVKGGFTLPRAHMSNADLARVINSSEVQSKLRPATAPAKFQAHKKNPLRNKTAMSRLNPYALIMRKTEQQAQANRSATRKARLAKNRQARRTASKAFVAALQTD